MHNCKPEPNRCKYHPSEPISLYCLQANTPTRPPHCRTPSHPCKPSLGMHACTCSPARAADARPPVCVIAVRALGCSSESLEPCTADRSISTICALRCDACATARSGACFAVTLPGMVFIRSSESLTCCMRCRCAAESGPIGVCAVHAPRLRTLLALRRACGTPARRYGGRARSRTQVAAAGAEPRSPPPPSFRSSARQLPQLPPSCSVR